jgi:DNA mismatch endonuclease, patch repair protein
MADNLTRVQRHHCMSRIRSRDTRPELVVRRAVHREGYRYKLHDARLPGCPDLVFPTRRKVIFVHGCFWHRHRCSVGRILPRSNRAYWIPKLSANRERDLRVRRQLRRLGWVCLVVWECEAKDARRLVQKVNEFLCY